MIPAAAQSAYSATPELIQFVDIKKQFGGTQALKGVSLSLKAGEILALLGENGAGKSTLIKILAGVHTPDDGSVFYHGKPYHHTPPKTGISQRVAFIHQDLGLLEWMTVAENIALTVGFPRKAGLISWRTAETLARRALDLIGSDIDPDRRVQDLSRTEKSMVAIARALAVDADVLVLDEPTASLPIDEVARLFEALKRLKQRGMGMIFVSHRLDEVFQIADRVAVLRDGRLVGDHDVSTMDPDKLVRLIVGRAPEKVFAKVERECGKPLLTVKDMRIGAGAPINFNVSQGEIVGLVGLRGAGQENVGRALFGCEPFTGHAQLNGQPYAPANPRFAISSGVGLIARERTEESTFPALSIRENIFANPGAMGRRITTMISRQREASLASDLGRTVGLRPNEPHLPIEALSGGNQQKVVVGRWLAMGCRLLIAEDPTAGVDVGAKSEIYTLMNEGLKNGLGIILISTDFEEVEKLCHRALVFSRGAIVDQLADAELDIDRLIHSASAGVG
ncbi:sugar ABC transporter ATP-binding protein [Phyllobacterium sp. 628]|uniref:sugar ABC transporter ATP-binding protein n=1 Tax=Phyllobacterium sp. 628 TaxID=2718938 RepID=UPI0016625A20|nr:sugar ABC transporter ATP-binding protein [Phyllobacterium sp. 628]QND50780.1 sugar ABC transporter ATP-binding protein [Phyllobacterium sp. 628]